MDDPISGAAGIALCLVLSAFFSGAETALTALSRSRARTLAATHGGRRLRLWIDRPAHVLTTILICNNVVNVLASALATRVAQIWLGDRSGSSLDPVAVAVGVMTLLLLTFGEITPKTLARAWAERAAPAAMRVLGPLTRLLHVPATGFVALATALGRLSGRDIAAADGAVREQDIHELARLASNDGTIEREHAAMIQRVFALDDTSVASTMLPWCDVDSVTVDASRSEVFRTLKSTGHSRLPVVDAAGAVVGLLYAKDMLALADEPEQRFDVSELVRGPLFVPPQARIDLVLGAMRRQRTHLAIVCVDGEPTGILTMEDILEQLVGPIFDEFDERPASRTGAPVVPASRSAAQNVAPHPAAANNLPARAS